MILPPSFHLIFNKTKMSHHAPKTSLSRIPTVAWVLGFLSLFLHPVLASADSVIVFNEIQYHPADTAGETEWIELRNLMGVDVDISGWAIDRGVNFQFTEGTIIPGHGFFLIAADPNASSLAGQGALGPFAGQLSNGGETLRLVNRSGRVMDELSYEDDQAWPVGADGSGSTLAKRNENSADTTSQNWIASPFAGGTPGAINFPNSNTPPVTSSQITLQDTWSYRDTSTPPPAGWQQSGFDDSSWQSGDATFYAGSADDSGAGVGLLGYWPLEETSGGSAPNFVNGAQAALLNNGANWLTDATRGQVLSFDGQDDFADAGSIPELGIGDDFTWSFWAYDQQGTSNNIIVGNRRSPSGSDFAPREFVKMTTDRVEWHENGSPAANIDFAVLPTDTWIHYAVVKSGSTLTYYRDGVAGGTSTLSTGLNNAQPFYFGGNEATENWQGRLDDPAIWERALPATAIAGLADGTYTPATAPTLDGSGGGSLQTELAGGSSAYYFRNSFNYSGDPERTSLSLRLLLDDGAVVYLNGTEVHRENMPAGTVSHGTFAENEITEPALGSGITIPTESLVQGINTLAIEVHQSSGTDTDMLFDADLTATELPPPPVGTNRALVFSEIAQASASNFRIELTNLGNSTLNLAGYVIRSSEGPSYTFPSGVLSAGNHLVLTAATLGFQPANNDRLFILRPGQSELEDSRSVTNRLRGLNAEGQWAYPSSTSFGSSNVFALNQDVVINEIMYNPRPLRQEAQTLTTTLLDWGATWRYNESGTDLGDTWETSAHPVGGNWQAGPGPLGFENNSLPVPLVTTLSPPNGRTIYFETDLVLNAAQVAALDDVQLSHLVDDGAIFYLNGVEIPSTRFKMNPEPTTFSTRSNGGGEAVLIQGQSIPSELFLVGSNRISVEVHQTSLTSSDVVFGLKLDSVQEIPAVVESSEQWIELHNRGTVAVSLADWQFTDGIDFTFPAGTILNPGGYLLVAANATALASQLPGVTVFGDFSGRLSRSGETLTLSDSFGNVADQVTYYDGGSWPEDADGDGASLELIDPRSDNSISGNWRPSREELKSSWQSYRYRASGANNGNDPTVYNEFLFGLLDNGEFLIDDISVVEDPDGASRQLIQNGTFESGTTQSWRIIGNHRHAQVIADPDSAGNSVLHLTATGSTEHQHNNAGTTLKNGNSFVTINDSLDYEISFRAKWLSGSNQFHSRLYFNRAARTTFLQTPDNGGTPGAPNSTQLTNGGPSLQGMVHSPAVPAANESCVVTVRAQDPDGVETMTLFYSVDEGAFESISMTEQEDGLWAAVVPGQAAASKVQFYLEAEDSLGATSMMPPEGPDSRAIIPFEDGRANMDFGDCQPNNLRIVITDSDRDFLHEITNVMSNDRLPCTVIWNESDIYYGCGVRLKGSQRGRGVDVRVGFNIAFPADNPFLGAHEKIAIDRSGSGSQFSQKEILVKHAINHAGGGIPGMQDDLIRIISPKSQHTSSAILLKSRYDKEFLDNMYQNGNDGTNWEFEFIYYATTTVGGDVEGLKFPNPDSIARIGAQSLGSDPELYRWHWLIKNNRDEDNFAPLIEMLAEYGKPASPQYLADMDRLIDVDQYLRAFAVQVLFGIGDSYSSGSDHNAIFYNRPEDGKFLYFPWDMDFAFSRSFDSSLTSSGDLTKLLTSPANRRAFYGHLQDIITTTYNTSYLTYWANHYSCFLPSEDLASNLSYIAARGSYALAQVDSTIPPVNFALTTPNSSTSDSAFVVTGEGWVDVREIRLAGSPNALPITWTDTDTFQVSVPVIAGTNLYTIEAYNFEGDLIGTDTIEITGVGDVIPAAADNLVITELMFNPATTGPEDSDDYEYIELLNLHPSAAIDLSGVTFSDGIDYSFPPGSQLASGERLVIPRNFTAFQSRYGSAINLAAEYVAADGSNMLSNGGESVAVLDSLGNLITSFTYNDVAPWPLSADGDGYSMELINPTSLARDPLLPINWRSSRTLEGNPGINDSENLADWMDENNIVNSQLDPDGDGLAHSLEFLLGTDPFHADCPEIETRFEGGYFLMDVVVRNGADGVLTGALASRDLAEWLDAEYLGRLNNEDNETSTLCFGTEILPTDVKSFLQLTVEEVP